ncbi:YihY/virulence factor BrkB family protein [Streptococcus sp. zg-JUN1979]|uniref:YihY/virulence factor BrkB family protein n=1 Tax=Streptococcus sp. zg-JUN1979 TaxID=3391450 RepID=UPI0039A65D22
MTKKSLLGRLSDKFNQPAIQIFLKHYKSAEMDLSGIAVAYYLLLTAFPLVVIAANIFPYLNINISDFLRFLEANLPQNLYEISASVITSIFSNPSKSVLGVATLTAFWTMAKSLTSLQKAINKAYGVSHHRDFVVGRLIGLATSFLLFFLLTFVLIISTFSKPFIQLLLDRYQLWDSLTTLLLSLFQPVTVITIFMGIMTLYFVLPNVRIKKLRYLLPGALFVTIVMVFFSNLVSGYIFSRIGRFVDIKVFGSVVMFILMVWFIFLANLIIFGAILNASYQELKEGQTAQTRRGDIASLIQGRSSKESKNSEE